VASLLRPAWQEVGSAGAPGEPEDRRELRASLVSALGLTARDPEVITKARALVLQELARPGAVEASLLNAVVNVAAKQGDAALYEQYVARSKGAADPEEKYRYLTALPSFTDPALVRRTMDDILGPDVRSQDAKLLIAELLRNREAQGLAWQLLRARWDQVQKKTGEFVGNTVIVGGLASFCDARSLAGIRRFFATHKVPDAERTLQQALERISACADLAGAQAPKLAAWLENRQTGEKEKRIHRRKGERERSHRRKGEGSGLTRETVKGEFL
jgi:aminopeptidase N